MAPFLGRLKILAGRVAVASMSLLKVRLRFASCVNMSGREVSKPGTPEAACHALGVIFSSSLWGAWSLARISTSPRLNSFQSPLLSFSVLIGGTQIAIVPNSRNTDWLSKRWWALASHVALGVFLTSFTD